MTDWEQGGERTTRDTIIGILLVMAVVGGGIIILTAPIERLLDGSVYSIRSAFHGLFASIFMVTVTIGLYQAFRLWSGTHINIREFEIGSIVNAFVCFLTILFGNLVYIPYQTIGGHPPHFLKTVPDVHKIFFEFKQYTGLFPLPLAVAAAYLICRYGARLNLNRQLREMVALLLVLTFFYFLVAFGLGEGITKLRPV